MRYFYFVNGEALTESKLCVFPACPADEVCLASADRQAIHAGLCNS